MSLIRWQPFSEIDGIQEEMNRLFDSLAPRTSDRLNSDFAPAAEMEETPEAIYLKLEVPGMAAEDIDVRVSTEAVAISGERRSQTRTEEKGATRSEFRYGIFRRVIPLPARVENTNVDAEYKDGILNLSLPKAEEEKNRVVKIDAG